MVKISRRRTVEANVFLILLLSVIFVSGINNGGPVTCNDSDNKIIVTVCGHIGGYQMFSFNCQCQFNEAANIGGWNFNTNKPSMSNVWVSNSAAWRVSSGQFFVGNNERTNVKVRVTGKKTMESHVRTVRIGGYEPYSLLNPNYNNEGNRGEFGFGTDYQISDFEQIGGHMDIQPNDVMSVDGTVSFPMIRDRIENFTATYAGCNIELINYNAKCPTTTSF